MSAAAAEAGAAFDQVLGEVPGEVLDALAGRGLPVA